MSRTWVVTGTGTEIGKTHLAEALLLATAAGGRTTLGVKPIESGVQDPEATDAARLRRASTFHVKPFGIQLPEPLSPHLAARRAGVSVDVPALAGETSALRGRADLVVVELAGGLFSPVSEQATNADLGAAIAPDAVLLVAPDRLGVLHDVLSTCRAAEHVPLPIAGIVLVAPAVPDASSGTNAAELTRFVAPPVVATIPRAPLAALTTHASVAAIVRWMESLDDHARAR